MDFNRYEPEQLRQPRIPNPNLELILAFGGLLVAAVGVIFLIVSFSASPGSEVQPKMLSEHQGASHP